MTEYNFKKIEEKWQRNWEESNVFAAEENSDKEKFYCLVEFPYPSGDGLHVGHPRSYTALDLVARKKRLEGYNVLYPMGWDAFGLPTENYAMKHNIHPAVVTERNVKNFKRQLKALGFSFDWDREINTTDPEYYKWTQWIFLQFLKKGLAYKKEMMVNWCPSCMVGLANEEVVDGACERCGTLVEHRKKNQWMLKITAYADRLVEDLKEADFIERVKTQTANWIGKSEGANLHFKTSESEIITVYTTRPDTVFGSTYMVISPEHEYLEKWAPVLKNLDEVSAYQAKARLKSEFERTQLNKEKTGVKLDGVHAINPLTGKEMPIFISDYVLATYGTGAIMAVPGHDSRDYEFAKAFDLPIVEVVSGGDLSQEAFTAIDQGTLINSDFLNGLSVDDAKAKIIQYVEDKNIGEAKVNFKLRDWVFSRQRYWGEPIPVIHCDSCGIVPLSEDDLPLELPQVESYEPSDDGESPLAKVSEWVNTTCPTCGAPAKRETDTMPQWAGSSWYFMRFADPHNSEALADPEKLRYWLPVDWYNGGMEHTTLHLLYSRFWYKFLFDIGVAPTNEPYQKRTSHGMILGENGEKMSKSRGNVVNPDDIINEFGADTFRIYEMFIGDFEKDATWNTQSIKGSRRYLDRLWALRDIVSKGDNYSEDSETIIHQSIKKVGNDIDDLKGNTAVAQLMILLNHFYDRHRINEAEFKTLLLLTNPFAPHLTEELWELMGFEGRITDQSWPIFDEAKCEEQTIEIAVQVNGKVRGRIAIDRQADDASVISEAKEEPNVAQAIAGKTIVKEIYIQGRIVNIVVR